MDTRTPTVALTKPRYTQGKQLAERIFFDTMAAIDLRQAMLSRLESKRGILRAGEVTVPLARPPRVVAFGKAANRMATALYEVLDGDGAALGISAGLKESMPETYCVRVIDGRLPAVIPDTTANQTTAALPLTRFGSLYR